MTARMGEFEFNQMIKKNQNLKVRFVKKPARRRIKKKQGRVNSRKVSFDGHLFASQKEVVIYKDFKSDPDIEIKSLHPNFPLIDGFTRFGKKVRAASYTADFDILEKGERWIVEVKSEGTAKMIDYQLRRKMFLNRYPELRFREIIFNGNKRRENVY